jgi:hypothetical protein
MVGSQTSIQSRNLRGLFAERAMAGEAEHAEAGYDNLVSRDLALLLEVRMLA